MYTTNKNDKAQEEMKKKLFKLYYPDAKDTSEDLNEELMRRVVNDDQKVMKMTVDSKKKIDPLQANALLKKKS